MLFVVKFSELKQLSISAIDLIDFEKLLEMITGYWKKFCLQVT